MKFRTIPHALALALLAAGCQSQTTAEAPAPERTEDQKSIYAFGVARGQEIAEQIQQLRFTPQELVAFQDGLSDAITGKKPAVEIGDYAVRFQELAQTRLQARANEAQRQGAEAIAAAIQEQGSVKTDSGLIYQRLGPGKGPKPKAADTVRVHYQGTLPGGEVFDSSIERGKPAEFALSRVIPCWSEGLQLMQVGEKAKLVCPPSIAYGSTGASGRIPPDATLIFEVELLGIVGK